MTSQSDLNQQREASLLLNRLERISADSAWAHRASGIWASIARHLSRRILNSQQLEILIDQGFRILEEAARQIPENKAD